jgi:phosphotransferase system  glucose/maltose/N-acetylglucosamine-specific IIC component
VENKNCFNCHVEAEWQKHYLLAVKRFDKFMNKALAMTMIAVVVALICIIITVSFGMKVIRFINSFEYVEETTYSIEQDDQGINTAVIGGDNEVNVNYGTEDH